MGLRKILAAGLSVVILFVTVPSSAATDDSEIIEALKTAWSQMEEPVLKVVPGSGLGGNVTAQYAKTDNYSYLPRNAEETFSEYVGERYVRAELSGTQIFASSYDEGTDYLKYGASTQDISGCNVYLSFYVEALNGELSFVPWFRKTGGAGNGTGKLYTVSEDDVGKWVTLNTEDLATTTFVDAVTNLGNSVVLRLNSTQENVIYFGSFLFTRKVTLPENSDDWDLADWIIAAEALNTSDYYRTEAFEAALSTASEAKKKTDILNAWTKMEEIIAVLNSSSTNISSHTGVTAFERISISNPDNLPDAAQKDIPYDTIGNAFEKATFPATNTHLSTFLRYSNTGSGVSLKGSKVYVSIFVNGTIDSGETISLLPYYREAVNSTDYSSVIYTREYIVTPENTGKWITLDASEITPSGEMTVDKIGNNLLFSVKSPKEIEIIFGSFLFTKPVVLPESAESWNLTEAFRAAKSLDLSGYLNAADMQNALLAADPQRKETLSRLKTAWSGLEEFVLEITPAGAGANHKGATGLTVDSFTASADSPEIVGSKTVTATFTCGNDSTALSGPMSNYILYNISTADITGCKVYFSFYAEKLQGELSFVPYYRATSATGVNTGKLYTVSADDLCHWVALDSSQITNEENFVKVKNLENRIVLGVNSTETNTITFGSFVFTRPISLPSGSENWSYEQWAEAAEALDISGYYRTAPFVEALEYLNGGIYGERKSPAYSVKYGNFSSEMMRSFGHNLLSGGASPSVKLNGASTANSSYRFSNLCDCDVSTGYSVANASWNAGENIGKYCDIYYDLGENYRFSKFFINHWSQQYLENGLYEIYVSDSMADLFKAESMVFGFDNTSDSENGTSVSQLITFEKQHQPQGRFVSFRICCSVSDWAQARRLYSGLLYLRLSELGIYGERIAVQSKSYGNLLNMSSGVFLYTMDYQSGKFTSVSDYENKTYSTKMLKSNLVDSNPFSVYDIYAGKKGEASIDIVINLKDDYVADAFTLKGGSFEEYWPSKMKLYIGATMDQVRSADSTAVHIFTERAKDGIYTYKTPPQTVQYIRFQIDEAQHAAYTAHMLAVISELEIMGYAEIHDGTLDGADYGDLNGDMQINIVDCVKMKKLLAREDGYYIIADLNKDGTMTSLDLALMKKFILGLIRKF